MEEALHKSQALHRQSERMAHLGHWEWDEIEGKLLSSSEEHARIFEMSVDEILSSFNSADGNLRSIHPEYRDWYAKSISQIDAQKNTDYELEYKIITRSGAVRHVQELGEVVFDETGRLIRTVGTLQDITAHKQAEEALHKSQALHRTEWANGAPGSLGMGRNRREVAVEFRRTCANL